MKCFYTFIAVFMQLVCLAQNKNNIAAEIDSYIHAVGEPNGFTGTIAIKHHGSVILEKGYGLADRTTHLENNAQTIHNLGSTGSVFTEMAVMLLHERKKLNLEDPICKYISGCPSHWREITVKHLLEQKSGLPDYLFKPDTEKSFGLQISKRKMIESFAKDSLEFTPGERFNASATSFYLLGVIVEKVTGESLGSFIRKNIFAPLKTEGFTILEDGVVRNSAKGYMINESTVNPAPFIHPSWMFGYGNLYGTASDLMAWEASLYGNGILSSESLQQIDAWTAAAGFGQKVQQMNGRNFRRYFKGTWGHRLHLLRFPSDSTAILLLTNNNSTMQDKFMRDIAAIIYGEYNEKKEIKEVSVDPAIMQRYVGVYEFAPGRAVTISVEDGKLFMQGTHRAKKELVAVSDRKFYIKGSEVYIEFAESDSVAAELTLYEISSTIKAKRKP
jgi:CubicO group peptidase (beta-lactamase class C family)